MALDYAKNCDQGKGNQATGSGLMPDDEFNIEDITKGGIVEVEMVVATSQAMVKSMDEMLQEAYTPEGPGAAVLVKKGDEVILRKGYGMANMELGIAIEPDMVFRIGSVTKQFTSVAILMLVEQGKVALEDEITRFLPDYPTQGHTVTIEHLLTHTSGIKSYTEMPEWMALMRKDLSLEELIAVFKDQPFDFAPGEKWKYNNSGYVLLGAIIEKAAGMSYAQFIQEKIFTLVGMKCSYYDDPARIIPRRACGYEKGSGGWQNASYISMTQPYAAGSLASSVDDLALWGEALLGETLVKQTTLEKAYTPYTLKDGSSTGYGFGWGVSQYAGKRLIEHGGGINGFICHALRIPEERVSVTVLTNSTDTTTDPSFLAVKIAAIAIGEPIVDPTPIRLEVETLKSYPGVYAVEEAEEWSVVLEGEQLFLQPPGGARKEMGAVTPQEFFVKGSLLRLHFHTNEAGKVTKMEVIGRFGPARQALRTDKVLPQDRPAIDLDPAVYDQYTGKYEIGAGMMITISQENGHLMVEMMGQEKVEIFPTSTTRFFLRVASAEIEFTMDEDQKVSGLVFEQGAMKLPAKKVG